MKLIVVGASGYIGRRILAEGRARGDAVGTSSRRAADFLQLDLARPGEFDFAIIDPGDVVLVTAANSSPDFCANNYDEAFLINVTGTSAVVERALARGAKVIFFSSDTVYGDSGLPVDESAACNPAGAYAQMKRQVEQRFAHNSHFKALRLSYVFSKFDKFTQYLLRCAQSGEKAQIFHPFYRSVVHLDDVVRTALAVAASWQATPAGVINVGGPQVIARTDLAEIIKSAAAPALQFAVASPPPGFFVNRPASIGMLSPLLGGLLGRPARGILEAAQIEFSDDTR